MKRNREKTKKYLPKNQYPPESAGRLMTKKVPTVKESAKVSDIENLLIEKSRSFDTIDYIYVLSESGRLKGVLSIKELYCLPKSKPIKGFFVKNPVMARAHTDQERVALLAVKHNIKAIPVVDKNEKFLGVVISDSILNILHSESVEDALRFAGSGKFENPAMSIIYAGAWTHFKKRLPWLVLGLSGGVLAAFIVNFFEESLHRNIILAAFIPAVVYMADAVGSQTQTIFIRSLALEHKLDIKKYVWREFRVNLLLAVLLGTIIFSVVLSWTGSLATSLTLGLSITLTIMIAMAIAISLPWILGKLKYDPAIASGPFATVTRDIMSLVIYFALASLFL